MKIKYKRYKNIDKQQLINLYNDVKWSSYTNDMTKLMRAFKNSSIVVSAWDENKLVGIIRCITDNETILLIQDIIVLDSYKRKGFGTNLINLVIDKTVVRQTLLQTDLLDEIFNAFYQKLGFTKSEDFETQSYVLYR